MDGSWRQYRHDNTSLSAWNIYELDLMKFGSRGYPTSRHFYSISCNTRKICSIELNESLYSDKQPWNINRVFPVGKYDTLQKRFDESTQLHNGTKFKELPTSLNQIPAFVISRLDKKEPLPLPFPISTRGDVQTSIASMDAYGGIRNTMEDSLHSRNFFHCSPILPFLVTITHPLNGKGRESQ